MGEQRCIWFSVRDPQSGRELRRRVFFSDYVQAKTAQLREFGYRSLTEETVCRLAETILDGKPHEGPADLVIYEFIRGDEISNA